MVTPYKKITNFELMFKRAKRERSPLFTVAYIFALNEQNNDGDLQCAFVASKKAVGKRAHDRNRAKRRMKAAWHRYLQLESKNLSGTFCFILTKEILTTPWLALESSLVQTMDRIKDKAYADLPPTV